MPVSFVALDLGCVQPWGLLSVFHGLSHFWTMPAWYWHSLHVPTRSRVLFRMTEQCRLRRLPGSLGSLPANSV